MDLNDETDRLQRLKVDCFYLDDKFRTPVKPSDVNQLALIKLKINVTVTDFVAPLRVCNTADVLNDTTVLRTVGMGGSFNSKDSSTKTKLSVCYFFLSFQAVSIQRYIK